MTFHKRSEILLSSISSPTSCVHLPSSVMPACDMWMLETDYTNMAVLYTCKEFMDMFYFEAAWIISRERTLPSRMVRAALDVLEREGIDSSLMMETDQTDCPVMYD